MKERTAVTSMVYIFHRERWMLKHHILQWMLGLDRQHQKAKKVVLNTLCILQLCSSEHTLMLSALTFFCIIYFHLVTFVVLFITVGWYLSLVFNKLFKHFQEHFQSSLEVILLINTLYTLPLCTRSLFSSYFNMAFYFCYFSSMWLLISHHLRMFICHLCLVTNTTPTDLPLVYLLSLRDLMCHRHTCKLHPAGLLLILGPPCGKTLSLSLPIILEHYWLLICLSAPPQISNVITKWTNNPLCSYLVVPASNTLFI